MYRKVAGIVIGGAAALNSATVAALGLGEMAMRSALHEPLDAEIKVTNVESLDPDQIKVRLADQKTFDMAGVDRTYFLTNLRFNVTLDGDGNATINVFTKKSVKEPFLDFLIEVRWPTGKVVRSYTALVDLPVYNQSATPVISGSVKTSPSQAVSPASSSSDDTYQSTQTVQTFSYNQESPESAENPNVAPDGSYRIQNNDTLFEIAKNVRPDNSYSINKTMLALQKINPDAFPDGNINRIRAGSILRIPTSQEINAYAADQAAQIVSNQNKVWRGAQLDGTATSEEYQSQDALPEGHLSLTSAGENDSLTPSAGEGGSANGGANADSLAASEMENAELSDKVTSLTDQINQLERLIELKDAELANLQAQLGQLNTETAPSLNDVAIVEETAAAVVEPIDTETLNINEADSSVATEEMIEATVEEVLPTPVETEIADSSLSDDINAAEAVTEEQPEPLAESAPEAVSETLEETPEVQSVASNQSSLMEKFKEFSPIHLGLFGLFIASLAAAFAIQRRNKKEREAMEEATNFEFNDFDESEDAAHVQEEVIEEAQDNPEPELTEEVQEEEASEPVILETDDALSEADIYIAYGRYDQAVSILENAIGANDDTVPLRNKLLNIYLESGNQDGFTEQYKTAITQGLAPVVTHAKDILSSSEHADWLSDVEDALIETSAEDTLDLDEATVSADEDFSFDSFESNEESQEESVEEVEESNTLAFDEDLLGDAQGEETTAFDLDQLDDDASDMDSALDIVEDSAEIVDSTDSDAFEMLELDDLEIDSEPQVANELEESAVDVVEFDVLDTLDSLDIEDSLIDSDTQVEDLADESLDESIDALAKLTENAFTDANESSFDEATDSDLDIDINDSDLDFIATTDEVGTKLDLARAYIDMGDFDGAKDMLKEVIEEGEGEQKEEANTLLESCV
jgi:pilus assembly protein FimV